MFYSLVSTSLLGVGMITAGCNKCAQPTVEQLSQEVKELTIMYRLDSLAYVRADLGRAQKDLNNIKRITANCIYGDSAEKFSDMSTEDLKAELRNSSKLMDDDIKGRCCYALDKAQEKYDIATGSVKRHTKRMLDQKVAELEIRLKN